MRRLSEAPDSSTPAVGESGSLTAEFALLLPVVALCAFALLQVVAVARDALHAQELARLGARIAATTPSDTEVRDAVGDAAGDTAPEVTVTPSDRGHGSRVEVRVRIDHDDRWISIPVTGRAVAHGEASLEGAGP